MDSPQTDLHVAPTSDALCDKTLDVVVSGSIGAVESVRFIRALRRLGATVKPWLTSGGAQFTTETALAWAAANPCQTRFEGTASHISLHDACIVAPASASLLGKVAAGITDTPATALIASYLGRGKPVFVLPNMHDSLYQSPFVAENIERLMKSCSFIEARKEEGKQKFPDPPILAGEIAHRMNRNQLQIMITMGTTRGYIDDVRYISNYSSGALGSRIAEELYRQGFNTTIIAGPSPIQADYYSQRLAVETTEAMRDAVRATLAQNPAGAVFAASVLDFVPSERRSGKIRSHEELTVRFKPTEKIIGLAQQSLALKVGFKLEAEDVSPSLIRDYLGKYQLSHLITNRLQDVSANQHRATIWDKEAKSLATLDGKESIARFVTKEAKRILLA